MAINKKLVNQVNAALGNPNVQAYLNMLSDSEGTTKYGYQQGFGRNNQIKTLDDHPREFHSFKTTDGKTQRTSAAGRYQFLSRTWDDQADKLGLTDFGPESQDRAAIGLIAQAGALDDLMKGDISSTLKKTGKIWASLPTAPDSYKQPKKDLAMVQKYFGEKLNAPTELALQTPAATNGGSNPSDVAGPSAVLSSNVAAETQPRTAFNVADFVNSRTQANQEQLTDIEPAPEPLGNQEMSWSDSLASIMSDGGLSQPSVYDDLAAGGAPADLGQSLTNSPFRDDIINAEADSARFEAMNQLFGEQPNTSMVQLPTEIDRTIRKFIEEVTA